MRFFIAFSLVLLLRVGSSSAQVQHLVGAGTNGTIYKIVDNEAVQLIQLNQNQQPQDVHLLVSNGKFWGMTTNGGEFEKGIIFSINTDGTGYAVVHSFDNTTGGWPFGGLTEFDGKIWGLARLGDVGNNGVIFNIGLDGTGYQVAYYLKGFDGVGPIGDLIVSNGKLWGVAQSGGEFYGGTIFSYSPSAGFQKWHDFNISDGFLPFGTLVESNGRLWGVALIGGANSVGNIFSIKNDGSDFRVDFDFNNNDSGAAPLGTLIESNGRLWGTTSSGGNGTHGTVYSIDNAGSDFTVVHEFTSNAGDNAAPRGNLLASGGRLWGTSDAGGENGLGYIYSLKEIGTEFTRHYSFKLTDSDGRVPWCTLIEHNGRFWGATVTGGETGNGVLFSLANDGSDYQIEHHFADANATGWQPNSNFIEFGDKLIGTTNSGGIHDFGVIYSLAKDGSSYSILHNFNFIDGSGPVGLIQFDNKLWGMTGGGGEDGVGTIFTFNPEDGLFTKVHDFNGSDGARPVGTLVESNGILWGVTTDGNEGAGNIFKFDPASGEIENVHDFVFETGVDPKSGLLINDGKFWGRAAGGPDLYEIIFTMDLDGSNYSIIKSLDASTGGNIQGGLIAAAGKIWGTTEKQIIFSMDNDGSNFAVHKNLAGSPYGKLTFFENKLFGVTRGGGQDGHDAVYAINADGTGFQNSVDLGFNQNFASANDALVPIFFEDSEPPITEVNKEIESNYIHIYPNPAGDVVSISIPDSNFGSASFQLIDLTGKVIKQYIRIGLKNGSVENMDLSDVTRGMYILKITSSQSQRVIRLVVK